MGGPPGTRSAPQGRSHAFAGRWFARRSRGATFGPRPTMLEFLRKSATSLFAWLILILLAVVFGFSFGLPSDSLSFGKTKFASVYGESIGEEEYRYEFNAIRRIVRIPQDARYQELMGLKEE